MEKFAYGLLGAVIGLLFAAALFFGIAQPTIL